MPGPGRAAVVLLLSLVFQAAIADSNDAQDQDAFVTWAKVHASPLETTDPNAALDDLEPLRAVVGDARVAGVGESFHGGREFLGLRHRVARFLVERMDFDAVALESGFPESRQVYDYVLGGDAPAALWDDGFTWTMADFPETRALVEWLREFNARTGRKVRFYGMDVAGAKGTWLTAARQVYTYLDQVEPVWSADIQARLTPLLAKFERPGRTAQEFTAANDAFAALPLAERNAVVAYANELADRFDMLRPTYLRVSAAEDYDWARQIALNLRAASTMVTNYEAKDRPNPVWNARDAAMASNVRWMLDRGASSGGVVVLAHNAHVQKAMATAVDPNMASAGVFLQHLFGSGYRTIGFTFGAGSMLGYSGPEALPAADADSIDGALSRLGLPLFLVDLQPLPEAAARWLKTPRKQRFQGIYPSYDQLQSWDSLIHVEQVSPSEIIPH